MGEGFMFLGLGEVYNTGTVKISAPHLSAVVRDGSNKLVAASESEGFCPTNVPPGSYTFGGYAVMVPTLGASAPQVQIEAWDASSVESYRLDASRIKVKSSADLTGSLTGTIENTSGKLLSKLTVCGAAYDNSGALIGANSVQPTLPAWGLPPGASFNFSIDLPVVLGVPSTGKAFAEGLP
jgi:hypothetical protein